MGNTSTSWTSRTVRRCRVRIPSVGEGAGHRSAESWSRSSSYSYETVARVGSSDVAIWTPLRFLASRSARQTGCTAGNLAVDGRPCTDQVSVLLRSGSASLRASSTTGMLEFWESLLSRANASRAEMV
jgi:hypothetical protein